MRLITDCLVAAGRGALLLVGCAAALLALPAAAARAGDNPAANQVMVELVPGASAEAFAARYGCTVLDGVEPWSMWLLGATPGTDLAQLVAQMLLDPQVIEAEANERFDMPEGVQRTVGCLDRAATPIGFRGQPAALTVNTFAAHQVQSGAGVVVAVLDTGQSLVNPETRGQLLVIAGANFIGSATLPVAQPDGLDNDGDGIADEGLDHGTLVAGAISLVAPGARIMPVRVLDEDGQGTDFVVAKGIHFALQHGADVINLSLATSVNSKVLRRAVDRAVAAGVVVIAAAGNDGLPDVGFPAQFNSAIAVAALDDDRMPTPWTNYGSKVSLSAPGVQVLSTFGDDAFGRWDGTSFAAPMVSGAAALLLERFPGLTPAEVRFMLQTTAQPIVEPQGYGGKLGAGELDAAALVQAKTLDRSSLKLDGPSFTTLRWSPVSGVTASDLARGDVGALHRAGNDVDLGPLTCVANDATSTTHFDAALPPAGQAFFYVFRDDGPDAGGNSYGDDGAGHPRTPSVQDCQLAR